MLLELVTPAVLPLAIASVGTNGGRKPGLIGLTLQHPLTHTLVYCSNQLQFTGPRAHIGRQYGRAFLQHANLPLQGIVELELATPSHMGLESDTMIGLTMARGLSWAHDLPPGDAPTWYKRLGLKAVDALALHAFDRGGLLVAAIEQDSGEPPGVLARIEIEHGRRDEDWVLVLFLPRVPPDAPEGLESDLLADLLVARKHLSSERLATASDALLSAAAADNLTAFAAAVMDIQEANLAGLKRAGKSRPYSEEEESILGIMRENGALAWGRSAAGLALFGLAHGGSASIGLRAALRRESGYEKGMVLATIVDNRGCRSMVHEEDPEYAKHLILDVHQGLLAGDRKADAQVR